MSIARKIATAIVASSIALTPALPALAAFHEGVRTRLQEQRQKLQERKEERQATVQEQKEAAQEKRQEVKKQLAEKRKQNIRAFFGRMARRLEAALGRQSKLGERIQSRIEKAKANGKDVTNAQTALDKAKAAWQEAQASLDTARGKLESALGAEDPKTAFKEVKLLVGAARDKIKAVHAAFMEVITALKGLGRGAVQESNPSPAP